MDIDIFGLNNLLFIWVSETVSSEKDIVVSFTILSLNRSIPVVSKSKIKYCLKSIHLSLSLTLLFII